MTNDDDVSGPRFQAVDTARLRSRTAEIGVILEGPRCTNRRYSYAALVAHDAPREPGEEHLNMYVEGSQPGFPDSIARRLTIR